MLVVAWKLLNADLKIDLATFSFTDFLALVLALFSVALSVAFYFKATDASNQFYDNTYRFTKEMAEILGRIEAGFGERLRHLDEGYTGMLDRLDRLPYNGATHSDVEREEEEIKKKESEQKAVIEELARKAKLAEHEKQELFENLALKSEELEQARIELRQMQESRPREAESHRRSVLQYVARKIKRAAPLESLVEPMTGVRARKLFDNVKPHLAEAALKDMERLDLLGPDGGLTRDAMMMLRIELKRT
ncbi:MAG: hypothetical protein LW862_16990 [Rubrivivax sp.]|jgi:hypothetical protein|nr:hypothetical protein [Rubrivivax sp.]